ncbi:MAG: DNA topoisomerase VI subunit B, partial [Candidatus Thorarchaeota archaeon]|nr:DNA topoisomerase VI subunit B [Candidatus Thorarchaeota archaeon]
MNGVWIIPRFIAQFHRGHSVRSRGASVLQSLRHSDSDVVELSVSAWFYRNRTIAGFDNPARSLYVSVRELVENSLDACEGAGVLPEVLVSLQQVKTDSSEAEGMPKGPQVFKLRIQDNGSGIKREDAPRLLGRMLTGTKFTLKQSRGTFGLGGSLALLYGQITTQKPIEITTGRSSEIAEHKIVMRLDIENNEPILIREEQQPKNPGEHGTTIEFYLQGDWFRSKRRITEYFLQTSMIVPYASMRFDNPDGESLRLPRVIEKLPQQPKEAKPHPRGIDVEMLKRMIKESRRSTLKSFLRGSFQRVGESTAEKFLASAGLDPAAAPKALSNEKLVHMMREFETYSGFLAPSSKSLSPAGLDVMKAGIRRLRPEFIVVRQRSPSVYEGHPFIVETGVSYGGELPPGTRLYRFANRIPLLHDERTDVSSQVIRE